MRVPDTYPFQARHFQWTAWDALIQEHGIEIDRPHGQPHPRFSEIIYPIDYGFVRGTTSSDGEPVDIFVGSGPPGVVGLILTVDFGKGDREAKLLYGCTPEEVYLVNGFINFNPELMQGRLVLRQPMRALWRESGNR